MWKLLQDMQNLQHVGKKRDPICQMYLNYAQKTPTLFKVLEAIKDAGYTPKNKEAPVEERLTFVTALPNGLQKLQPIFWTHNTVDNTETDLYYKSVLEPASIFHTAFPSVVIYEVRQARYDFLSNYASMHGVYPDSSLHHVSIDVSKFERNGKVAASLDAFLQETRLAIETEHVQHDKLRVDKLFRDGLRNSIYLTSCAATGTFVELTHVQERV